mmetsp:Transcript_21330/g.33372  ORF Transcript_21330/g.33372 Transcript_21330/m.33372 type:complete len:312 (+) Transcript_21330:313-1248(+)|eukprot:CAMPEP_0184295764 /NCGR_PEP_ID=MMETSP1049-20130417/6650_1 /TAXON_ID=77928 /ORGANISM="Proteomonas sulcata, Strain CCMP704" /LENGTH=311 /DNA_ID=CAMNT_0026604507 /DNA_START=328 /DNA_END=1263 /DNA_ORIENTATION=-
MDNGQLASLVTELGVRGADEETKKHASEALALLTALQAAVTAAPPKPLVPTVNRAATTAAVPKAPAPAPAPAQRSPLAARQDGSQQLLERSMDEGAELLARIEKKNDHLRKFIMNSRPLTAEDTPSVSRLQAVAKGIRATAADLSSVQVPQNAPKLASGIPIAVQGQGHSNPELLQRFAANSFQPVRADAGMSPSSLALDEINSQLASHPVVDIEMRQARIKLDSIQSELNRGQSKDALAQVEHYSSEEDDMLHTQLSSAEAEVVIQQHMQDEAEPPLPPEEVEDRQQFATMLLERQDFSAAIEDGSALSV